MERRLEWIDVAKGLGIVLVVYGHASLGLIGMGLAAADSPLGAIDYAIYTFHMPLFFFISGLFARGSLAKGASRFWRAKLRFLVYPYFLWSFLQLGLQMGLPSVANHRTTLIAMLQLLWAPQEQFWFIYALFCSFALIAILQRASDRQLLAVAASLFAIRFFLDVGVVSTVMWSFFYFALGVWLSDRVRAFRPSARATALLCLTFIVIAFGGLGLGVQAAAAIPASICGIAATLALSRQRFRGVEILRFLGSLSFPIYVMHVMATGLVRSILLRLAHIDNVAVLTLAGTAAGLALPVLGYVLLTRVGLARWFGFAEVLPQPKPRRPAMAAKTS